MSILCNHYQIIIHKFRGTKDNSWQKTKRSVPITHTHTISYESIYRKKTHKKSNFTHYFRKEGKWAKEKKTSVEHVRWTGPFRNSESKTHVMFICDGLSLRNKKWSWCSSTYTRSRDLLPDQPFAKKTETWPKPNKLKHCLLRFDMRPAGVAL